MARIFLLSAVLVAGCAQAPRMPVDVALVPNDCVNQQRITAWLEDVAATPRPPYLSQRDYDTQISAVKTKLWSVRYHCQSR